MQDSPARMFAVVFGVLLILAGVLGFAAESSFSGDDRATMLGLIDVNGLSSLLYLVAGALGILAWRAGDASARQFAAAAGLAFAILAIGGFVAGDGETLLSALPVSTGATVWHLIVAVAGIGAYVMGDARMKAGRPTPAA